MRIPRIPTHEPTGSIPSWRAVTPTFVRRLGLAHLEDDIALRDPLHRRSDQFALAIHIFAVDMLALDLFDALQNHLFGRLRSDTAEVVRCTLDQHRFAKLHIRLDTFGDDI